MNSNYTPEQYYLALQIIRQSLGCEDGEAFTVAVHQDGSQAAYLIGSEEEGEYTSNIEIVRLYESNGSEVYGMGAENGCFGEFYRMLDAVVEMTEKYNPPKLTNGKEKSNG